MNIYRKINNLLIGAYITTILQFAVTTVAFWLNMQVLINIGIVTFVVSMCLLMVLREKIKELKKVK